VTAPRAAPLPVAVRALETDAEIAAFTRLATAQFFKDRSPSLEATAARWRRCFEDAPHYLPEQWRGAFLDGRLVGGYVVEERTLRLGPARLRCGCIGAVVADPDHRGRGVGRAMMRDSVAYAVARRQALLFLYGAPGYYPQFGYADVADVTEHDVDLERIAALEGASPAGYRTRPATPADAPALLELYRRHHGAYRGAFERTLEDERYLLRHRLLERPPLVAVDGDDTPRGYLMFAYGPWWRDLAQAHEVAAGDWPATLALLRAHAALLAALPAPPPALRWQAPPDSAVVQHLGDHLPLVSRTSVRPGEGWEARLVHLEALFESCVPHWTDALAALRRREGSGPYAVQIAVAAADGGPPEATATVGASAGAPAGAGPPPVAVRLSPRLLAPLLFGYRPAAWAAAHPEASVPAAALPLLDALFPSGTPWVPGTDAF
jgi:predicted N-acetyltransferase YhbS